MNVLVVGGAGYIGSHTTRYLKNMGLNPIVFDNLSTGFSESVKSHTFIPGDLHDQALVERVLSEYEIEGVMHFAACALVGESVQHPAKYYDNNVIATFRLLEAMRRCKVSKFVFSSTCATYGEPERIPIDEHEKQMPINPYGFTKLAVERMLHDYTQAYDFSYAALRYFNAAGASTEGDIGEDHQPESHLIPLVLQVALGQRPHITIFGDDYDTSDGTCVRDYIHIYDLASAHLAALKRLQPKQEILVNLGTGNGYSVLEIIEMCRKVTGHPIPCVVGDRRPGDPPALIANPAKANNLLNWHPEFSDLENIVKSAWNWHKTHPNGYAKK